MLATYQTFWLVSLTSFALFFMAGPRLDCCCSTSHVPLCVEQIQALNKQQRRVHNTSSHPRGNVHTTGMQLDSACRPPHISIAMVPSHLVAHQFNHHTLALCAASQVEEGAAPITVGTPVATFVESEESLQQLREAGPPACPTTDVYDEAQPSVPVLPWQSFLKAGSRTVKCMG